MMLQNFTYPVNHVLMDIEIEMLKTSMEIESQQRGWSKKVIELTGEYAQLEDREISLPGFHA